jgi:transcriptional regulator with XRE-family HTH domain
MEVMQMTENQRVRYLRKELLKMTGTEFGKKIGVQNTAISKIELGENNLTDQARMLICSTFGVREAWLRDGEGEPFNVPDSRDEEIADFVAHALSDRSPEIQRTFLHVLSRLTDEQWAALADIAEALVEEQLRQENEDAAP